MNDPLNHSPNLGSVWQSKRLLESLESKGPDGLLLVSNSSDCTLNPFDSDCLLHTEFFNSLLYYCFTPLVDDLFGSLQLIDGLEGGFDQIIRVV